MSNHTAVIILAILALFTAIALVVFSLRQGKQQEREAKERGAFVRGLQVRDADFVRVQGTEGR